MKVLDKFPLCNKIANDQSYLSILNGNRDISNLIFGFFVRVQILQCIVQCTRNFILLEYLGYLA
jgi:hypothetical protein